MNDELVSAILGFVLGVGVMLTYWSYAHRD